MAPHGACILGCGGAMLDDSERRFFRAADPLGFILFARNVESPDQLRALCSELRETVGRDAPILIDQEGGRVARLRAPHWHEWLPALAQVQRCRPADAPRAMWLRYRLIADDLRGVGIDVNCAPMVDVPGARVHPIIRDRCYGLDAATVTRNGRAVADGLLAGGVLPVLKHIPGHGRPDADSHVDLPRTDVPLEALREVDFAPFKALADLPMGMTAHVVYGALDPDRPATLSPVVLDVIRHEIGFDGLLMSDDLSMQALQGSLAKRATGALAAGCDVVLHCNGDMAEMEQVATAAGHMDGAATRRADSALALRHQPDAIDRNTLLAELDDLLMLDG